MTEQKQLEEIRKAMAAPEETKTAPFINLRELADKSGKSEVEIAKLIVGVIITRARVTGVTQKVVCCCTENEGR